MLRLVGILLILAKEPAWRHPRRPWHSAEDELDKGVGNEPSCRVKDSGSTPHSAFAWTAKEPADNIENTFGRATVQVVQPRNFTERYSRLCESPPSSASYPPG